jgi:hypothetical protein
MKGVCMDGEGRKFIVGDERGEKEVIVIVNTFFRVRIFNWEHVLEVVARS